MLRPYEKFFGITTETAFRCPQCGSIYQEGDLTVAGIAISFCPRDKFDLVPQGVGSGSPQYTEEEIKIIGTIRTAKRDDHVLARQVADDVGCYVQKVAKFGEKLEREGLARRERDPAEGKLFYYDADE